jgi:ABC-type microcin C transport system duplicated ATPase subunit YejF
MVFQDPMTSLNPVLRISRQLIETMTAHDRFTPDAARTRAASLLGAWASPGRSACWIPGRTSSPAGCASG